MPGDTKLQNYFASHLRFLQVTGMSLEKNKSFLSKIYTLITFILVFIYTLTLILDIIININNFDIIVNSVYNGIGMTSVLVQICVLSYNRERLNDALDMLQNGVFAPNRKRGSVLEEKWIKNCVSVTNRQVKTFCYLMIVNPIISTIIAIIKRLNAKNPNSWELPFGKFSIFHTNRSPNFELALLFQITVYPTLSVIYITTISLIFSVFFHVCVQYKILRNSIKYAFDEGRLKLLHQNESLRSDCNNTSQKLKEIVLYHMAIIDLINQFEGMFNLLVLVNYVVVMICLGCIMYHGTLYQLTDSTFQKDACICLTLILELFFLSYWGNEVFVESQLLANTCYEVKFIGMDLQVQKGLCLMMLRCRKPAKFTAGKFSDLSLNLFVSIIRASFSYYMLLHNIN